MAVGDVAKSPGTVILKDDGTDDAATGQHVGHRRRRLIAARLKATGTDLRLVLSCNHLNSVLLL